MTFAVFCQLLFAQCNQLHILTEDVVYANQLAEEMGETILMIIWSLYRIGLLLLQRSIYDTVRQENPLGMWVTRALHWPRRAASVNLWRRFQCLMIGAPPLSITCRRAADAVHVGVFNYFLHFSFFARCCCKCSAITAHASITRELDDVVGNTQASRD